MKILTDIGICTINYYGDLIIVSFNGTHILFFKEVKDKLIYCRTFMRHNKIIKLTSHKVRHVFPKTMELIRESC